MEQTELDILQGQLASPLPLDGRMPNSVPAILGRECPELLVPPLTGRALGEVLGQAGGSVSIEALGSLARYFEAIMGQRQDAAGQVAASVLYLAIVARAQITYGRNISSMDPQTLGQAFSQLAEQLWIPASLAAVFSQARQDRQAAERIDPGDPQAFGSYRIAGRFQPVTGTSIHVATKPGGDPGREYIVKVFKPFVLAMDDDQIAAAIGDFLSAARLQQQLAHSGSAFWAPVYELGPKGGLAYSVTDRFDFSLDTLAKGRVKMTARLLHRIIGRVVRGLHELDRSHGRPHGALKGANVLFRGADVNRADVVLSDPRAPAGLAQQAGKDDLRAVGQLICELVLHRSPAGRQVVVLSDSPAWQAIGRKEGSSWRELAGQLLNAGLATDIDLQGLADAMAKL